VVEYEVEKVGIITISRETESLGDEIAAQLSKQLNYECIDRERLAMLLREAHQEDLEDNVDRQKFLFLQHFSYFQLQVRKFYAGQIHPADFQ